MKSLKLMSYITAIGMVLPLSVSAQNKTAKPEEKKTEAPTDSDKLDIQKLEQKYWSAKDDDFSVIQNRAFAKEKRWYFSANYGSPFNDPNSVGNLLGINVGYFFNERWGLELNYNQAKYKDNDTVDEFKGYGTKPNANRYDGATSLIAYWVPIYAKMSLLDKKIIYFDMGVGFGFGNTSFNQQKCIASSGCATKGTVDSETVETKKTALHYSLNVFQQFFISSRWAVRADFINRWTNEERLNFKTGASIGDKMINDTALQIGITFWK